jgi:hypothetical protein
MQYSLNTFSQDLQDIVLFSSNDHFVLAKI